MKTRLTMNLSALKSIMQDIIYNDIYDDKIIQSYIKDRVKTQLRNYKENNAVKGHITVYPSDIPFECNKCQRIYSIRSTHINPENTNSRYLNGSYVIKGSVSTLEFIRHLTTQLKEPKCLVCLNEDPMVIELNKKQSRKHYIEENVTLFGSSNQIKYAKDLLLKFMMKHDISNLDDYPEYNNDYCGNFMDEIIQIIES